MSIGPAQVSAERYSYSNYDRIQFVGFSKYTGNVIYAFDLDSHMYIFSRSNKDYLLTEKIMIRLIPSNPMDLINYLTCAGKPCFSAQSEYPIDLWMWQTTVKPYIINEIAMKLGIPMDTENNAKDDTLNQGAKGTKAQAPKEEQ